MHAYTDRYTIIDQLKGYYSFTAITQEFVPPHNIMKYIIVYLASKRYAYDETICKKVHMHSAILFN